MRQQVRGQNTRKISKKPTASNVETKWVKIIPCVVYNKTNEIFDDIPFRKLMLINNYLNKKHVDMKSKPLHP